REERELISQIKQHPSFKKLEIYSAKDNLAEAEAALTGGQVVGVDGTISKYRLFSGIRCQIGVVAVNYVGDKIRHSFFISEASLKDQPTDAIERVSGRATFDDNLSDMALRGLMLYREREAALASQFENSFMLLHGPLLPFELMNGLGRLRALSTTLDILRQLVREKRLFSIISSTAYQDYLTFGRAIEPGQYLTASTYPLATHIVNTRGFLSDSDRWREQEKKTVEQFVRDYADKIMIG